MRPTTLFVNKTDYPSPGTVDQSINELAEWRKVRAYKDLPNGALDNAIMHLQGFRQLLINIYEAELADLSIDIDAMKRGGCVICVDLSAEFVDSLEENKHV